ncbi:MAG: hypothetical protein RL297_943 [Pseudomonadota bacterium]|jgi:hypothetical protein
MKRQRPFGLIKIVKLLICIDFFKFKSSDLSFIKSQ